MRLYLDMDPEPWRYRIAEWIANPLAAIVWAIIVVMAVMKKRRYAKT